MYTKSIISDFGGNKPNISQLLDDLNTSAITPTVDKINIDGDVVSILFTNVLTVGETTILNTVVSTHTPRAFPKVANAYIDANSTLVRHDINNIKHTYIASEPNVIYISKNTQGHYTTLKAALLANNTPNHTFILNSGTYIEDNPLVLPVGTVIRSLGNAETTIITAMNPNSDLIVLNTKCTVEKITIHGTTGSGARGVYFNGSLSGGAGRFSALFNCFVVNCDIGIECDGVNSAASDTLFLRECVVKTTVASRTTGILCQRKGFIISMACQVAGVPYTYPFTNGILCRDLDSKVSMTTTSSWFCTNGLYVDNSGEAELNLITYRNCTKALVIGPTGVSRTRVSTMEVRDSTQFDIDVQAVDTKLSIYSAMIDGTKINNPNKTSMNIIFTGVREGKIYQGLLGKLNIGSTSEPSYAYFGQGDYDDDVKFLLNTNLEVGTWTDITSNANLYDGTTFDLFANTAVNNCLYIGRTENPLGVKFSITTATISPMNCTDIIWEYWDGAWIAFNVMQNKAMPPYHTIENSFVSAIDTYHIRFGLKTSSPLVDKTIGGFNRRWVRARVATELVSMPQTEYIKAHVSSVMIGKDGFIQRFGNARCHQKLMLDFGNSFASGSLPGNQDLYVSDRIGIDSKLNRFAYLELSRIGINTYLPCDLDTSMGITLNFMFIGDTSSTGNVRFTVRYTYTNVSDAVYTSTAGAPTSTANEKSSTVDITVDTAQILYTTFVTLDICKLLPLPQSGIPGLLWLTVERDATVGNLIDTYSGNISIVQFLGYYTAWNNGGHMLI